MKINRQIELVNRGRGRCKEIPKQIPKIPQSIENIWKSWRNSDGIEAGRTKTNAAKIRDENLLQNGIDI